MKFPFPKVGYGIVPWRVYIYIYNIFIYACTQYMWVLSYSASRASISSSCVKCSPADGLKVLQLCIKIAIVALRPCCSVRQGVACPVDRRLINLRKWWFDWPHHASRPNLDKMLLLRGWFSFSSTFSRSNFGGIGDEVKSLQNFLKIFCRNTHVDVIRTFKSRNLTSKEFMILNRTVTVREMCISHLLTTIKLDSRTLNRLGHGPTLHNKDDAHLSWLRYLMVVWQLHEHRVTQSPDSLANTDIPDESAVIHDKNSFDYPMPKSGPPKAWLAWLIE